MTENEKLFFEKHPEIKDVPIEKCYMGGKHCATCKYYRTYDSKFKPFENSYCDAISKENV